MKKCLQTCKELETACPINECRYWVNYPQDSNCTFETIEKYGNLTLREVADRLDLSYVRIKQIKGVRRSFGYKLCSCKTNRD